jgi:subtilisin family serine protease
VARLLSLLLVLAAFALGGCAASGGLRESGGERILVTLRYDAVDAIHGDPVERYRRPRDYGAGSSAEPLLNALAAEYGIARVSGWPMRALGVHCEVYALAPGTDSGAVVARLARDPRVDSAEPLQHFRTLTSAADPYRSLQHGLDGLEIGAAHALTRGQGVRVAVIDSGIDPDHPDLNGAVRVRRNFAGGKQSPHGTEVAGVIAARANNGVGIVGVAPEAELMDLRACWGDGDGAANCDGFSLAQAIDFAVSNGADVINLSLAGPDDALLARLLAAADGRGIDVVAAAAPNNDPASRFPSSVVSVITVADAEATAGAGSALLRAPGTDVLTTFPGARYDYASGSSLASAHVAGVVALARALDRKLDPQQLRALLTSQPRLSAAAVLADVAKLQAVGLRTTVSARRSD